MGDRYIVTRSNYSVRKKHKSLSNSNIYVRDYMITNSPGNWPSDSFGYGEGNFKFINNPKESSSRKHSYGEWLTQDKCNAKEGKDNTYWTKECVADYNENSENQILDKPNFSSFLDFVYYGKCEELLKNSITDIIERFPAELYVTDEPSDYYSEKEGMSVNYGYNVNYVNEILNLPKIEGDLVRIDNPFNINIIDNAETKSTVERDFVRSSNSYELMTKNESPFMCIDGWSTINVDDACKVGDIRSIVTISDKKVNGKPFVIYAYLTPFGIDLFCDKAFAGFRIRPNKDVIDKFWAETTDFEKLLLNQNTNPRYTCTIDYPRETDEGIKTSKRMFTWPSLYGWNLDISSNYYRMYVDSLLDLCTFYDENMANNLVRRMTHEAIKNLDLAYKMTSDENDIESISLGISRFEKILSIVSTVFDDIKHKIDAIGNVNNVTYNENSNLPDYFLSDALQMSGWDVKTVLDGIEPGYCVKNLYDAYPCVYTDNDMNVKFMNRLKINSKAILSRKGTRQAIEMLLGLFGLKSKEFAKREYNSKPNSLKLRDGNNNVIRNFDDIDFDTQIELYDYSVDEYVYVAEPKGILKGLKDSDDVSDVEKYNALKTNYDGSDDYLKGLPIATVFVTDTDGNVKKYYIPWFKNNEELDGSVYFQMYGGWGKLNKKFIEKRSLTNEESISSSDGFSIYSESCKYMPVVESIYDLTTIPDSKLSGNDIVYVNTLDGFEGKNPSHYFYCEKIKNSNTIGEVREDDDEVGWENIPLDEINDAKSGRAVKVLYLETIIDNCEANNPHCGYGKYDEGQAFVRYFENIFDRSIDEDLFSDEVYDCSNGEISSDITEAGFKMSKRKDNAKCKYYTDVIVNERLKCFNTDESFSYDMMSEHNRDVYSKPYDFEKDEYGHNTETAANSIVNSKEITITFAPLAYGLNDENVKYIQKSVIPFLNQIIPSTTILKYEFDGYDNTEFAVSYPAVLDGISDDPSVLNNKITE